jgi:sulfate/thiosulfate transport system substrate-binding protein
MRRTYSIARQLAAAAFCALAAGCGAAADSNSDTLKLGGYSVVKEAFHDGLLPAFKDEWKRRTGRDVRFEESYNGSGAQARSIASGFDADVAVLSHTGDMDVLVKAGLVSPGWDAGDSKGILTHSLVVIGLREGNPREIHDWADLAKPGVGVLYPDPKTSGGARWNINALYGATYLSLREAKGGEPETSAIRDFLAKVQGNVVNMDPSGRQSMASFTERGTGDAVVTYENELLLQGKEGAAIPYVIPPRTLLIESPAAIVDASVEAHANRKVAEAFLEFVRSEKGQAILADYGFRPVKSGVPPPSHAQPLPPKLFTIAELGGWAKIERELYGPQGLWTSIFTAGAEGR